VLVVARVDVVQIARMVRQMRVSLVIAKQQGRILAVLQRIERGRQEVLVLQLIMVVVVVVVVVVGMMVMMMVVVVLLLVSAVEPRRLEEVRVLRVCAAEQQRRRNAVRLRATRADIQLIARIGDPSRGGAGGLVDRRRGNSLSGCQRRNGSAGAARGGCSGRGAGRQHVIANARVAHAARQEVRQERATQRRRHRHG